MRFSKDGQIKIQKQAHQNTRELMNMVMLIIPQSGPVVNESIITIITVCWTLIIRDNTGFSAPIWASTNTIGQMEQSLRMTTTIALKMQLETKVKPQFAILTIPNAGQRSLLKTNVQQSNRNHCALVVVEIQTSVNMAEIKPEHVSISGIQMTGSANVLKDMHLSICTDLNHATISTNVKLVIIHVPLIIAKIKSHIKMVAKNSFAMHRDHGHNRKNGVSIIKIIPEIHRPETGNSKHGIKMDIHKVPAVTTMETLQSNTANTHIITTQVNNNGNSAKIIPMVIGSNMIGQMFNINRVAHSKVKLKSRTVKAKAGRPK